MRYRLENGLAFTCKILYFQQIKENTFKNFNCVNSDISKYLDTDSSCCFCKQAEEICFFGCLVSKQFWSDP